MAKESAPTPPPAAAPTLKIKLLTGCVLRAPLSGKPSEHSRHEAGEIIEIDPVEARGLISQGKAEAVA
jgi:hypothetical protein